MKRLLFSGSALLAALSVTGPSFGQAVQPTTPPATPRTATPAAPATPGTPAIPRTAAPATPATPAIPATPATPSTRATTPPAAVPDSVRGVRDPVRDARDAGRDAARDTRETAREIRQDLRDTNQNFRAADLGLWFSTRPGADGLVIADIANQGAIASVGFRENDRIISINGQPVSSESAFLQALKNPAYANQNLNVIVHRNGQPQTLAIQPTLISQGLIAADPYYQYGVLLDDSNPNRVVVQRVFPRTAAYYSGLRAGDVITSIGGQPIAGISAFSTALQQARGDLALQITRSGQIRDVSLAAISSDTMRTALRPTLDAQGNVLGSTDGAAPTTIGAQTGATINSGRTSPSSPQLHGTPTAPPVTLPTPGASVTTPGAPRTLSTPSTPRPGNSPTPAPANPLTPNSGLGGTATGNPGTGGVSSGTAGSIRGNAGIGSGVGTGTGGVGGVNSGAGSNSGIGAGTGTPLGSGAGTGAGGVGAGTGTGGGTGGAAGASGT